MSITNEDSFPYKSDNPVALKQSYSNFLPPLISEAENPMHIWQIQGSGSPEPLASRTFSYAARITAGIRWRKFDQR